MGRSAATTPSLTLGAVRGQVLALADPARAEILQRFFQTAPGGYGEGDRFLGLRVPQLRRIARANRDLDRESLLALLASPWHEERLLALLIFVDQYRRGSASAREEIFRTYLANTRHIDNWDLVDSSAEQIVGAHLAPDDLAILERLAGSNSLWERRIAMIATFYWIRRGIFDPALRIAELLLDDPHDLIHKAAGWMLREVGKRDRAREEAFLRRHHGSMPRVMLRYALEHFPEEERRIYYGARSALRRPRR